MVSLDYFKKSVLPLLGVIIIYLKTLKNITVVSNIKSEVHLWKYYVSITQKVIKKSVDFEPKNLG